MTIAVVPFVAGLGTEVRGVDIRRGSMPPTTTIGTAPGM
jgi:hypothetical protein